MAEIAQGEDPMVAGPGVGCAAHGGQPCQADATQLSVATGLVRLSFLVQAIYSRVSERHDLTPVQAKLLSVVAETPRGMADLANDFGVERAALTGLVDRVERRGLAERTSVPGDRRAWRVAATDAGRQAATAFTADIVAELDGLATGLSPHNREHFRRVLADIVTTHGPACHEDPAQRAPAQLLPAVPGAGTRRRPPRKQAHAPGEQ